MAGSSNSSSITDPLFLANSDIPSMSLSSISFDGTNLLAWSRLARMALGAKLKLGFLDGTISKPEEFSVEFVVSSRNDSMVRC